MLWFLLLLLPMIIGSSIASGSSTLSALYFSRASKCCLLFIQVSSMSAALPALHCFCTSTSCLLYTYLWSLQPSTWTASHTGSFSAFCLPYCLMPTACLLCYILLLANQDFPYLACLTVLNPFLVYKKCTYFFNLFLYFNNINKTSENIVKFERFLNKRWLNE